MLCVYLFYGTVAQLNSHPFTVYPVSQCQEPSTGDYSYREKMNNVTKINVFFCENYFVAIPQVPKLNPYNEPLQLCTVVQAAQFCTVVQVLHSCAACIVVQPA